MKKVLYIHHGDINGGAPRSLHYLLEELDTNKYKPFVVYRSNEVDGEYFQDTGAKVIYEPQIKPFHGSTVSGISIKQIIYNFVFAIPTFLATERIIKNIKPDIVHLNSTCLFMCARAAKKTDKNIKVICHIREPLLSSIWGKILRVMCQRYCDKFVAIDSYDGHTVDPEMKKTTVIYNFVDFDTYNNNIKSNVLRDELGIDNNDIIFLMLARVSPENGVLELISLWKKNVKENNIHLVIVGEIPGREVEYTNKCHLMSDGTNNIHFLPFRSDVQDVIASADIMICSFSQPHFARMIIEGAAMGKPALSVDIDGPKELIVDKKTGFLYKDETSFVNYVNLLSRNTSMRDSIGNAAMERAYELFNAKNNAKQTFVLYEE